MQCTLYNQWRYVRSLTGVHISMLIGLRRTAMQAQVYLSVQPSRGPAAIHTLLCALTFSLRASL